MKNLLMILLASLPLFANEIDDLYYGDDEELESLSTPWELNLSGIYYHQPDYANSNTLSLSYNWYQPIYSFNLNTELTGAYSAYYDTDAQIQYFSEPSLYFSLSNSWSETNLNLWGLTESFDDFDWGYSLSTLVKILKWQQGELDLGTFYESSELYGDYLGLFLYTDHQWDLDPFYHGPSLNLRATMDLDNDITQINSSKQSKINSSIASWTKSSLDLSYNLAWYSSNQLWRINSEIGYLISIDSFKKSKRAQSESLGLDEIWAQAGISRWF